MKRLLATVTLLIAASAALMVPAWAATDPARSKQWGLSRIRAEQAWSASKGSGVTIAIIDTGIDVTHPDLKGKIASRYTCISGACASGGDDDHGHGSHVAGVAAAATSNGVGIAGVAPSAKLMAVKALDADGSGACSDVGLGIRWAADHGADVVNLSLGPDLVGLDLFCGLQSAAEYAWRKGVVVVVAAGNDGLANFYGSTSLIVVGATGPNDEPASYSNSGADIYAPGGNRRSAPCSPANCIYSTWKDGGYASAQGTSMATPHVSGIAALLLARGYSNTQVLSRLRSTADNVDGILRVNAARAVGAATTSPTSPKSSPKQSTKPGSTAPRVSVLPTTPGPAASPPTRPSSSTSTSPSVEAATPASKDGNVDPGFAAPNGSAAAGRAVITAASLAALLAGTATVLLVRRRRRRA